MNFINIKLKYFNKLLQKKYFSKIKRVFKLEVYPNDAKIVQNVNMKFKMIMFLNKFEKWFFKAN